eukprot:gene39643-47117_t
MSGPLQLSDHVSALVPPQEWRADGKGRPTGVAAFAAAAATV